jgi:hypothetical protein
MTLLYPIVLETTTRQGIAEATRQGKTNDAVFDLTPAEFDAAFRQYAGHRFGSVIR